MRSLLLVSILACCLLTSPLVADETAAANDVPILWTADWSPDGKQILVGGEDALWLFDANKLVRKDALSPKQNRPTTFTATAAVWHPKKRLFAVTSQDGDVDGIYNPSIGECTTLAIGHGRGVAWKSSGSKLATVGSGDGHLKIWSSAGKLLHDVPRQPSAAGLTGVAWRPSGDTIVTVGKFITLHRADGTPFKQIVHRPEAKERLCLLLCVRWHPSGEFFVVGDYGNEVDEPVLQFWSHQGELLKSISVPGSEIRNVAWNREGRILASASDKLILWDEEGERMYEADSPGKLWGIGWSPDGHHIVTSSETGRVTLWNSSARKYASIVNDKVIRSPQILKDAAIAYGYPGTMCFHTAFHTNNTSRYLLLRSSLKIPEVQKYLELDVTDLESIKELKPVAFDRAKQAELLLDPNAQADEETIKAEYFAFLTPEQMNRLDHLAFHFDGYAAITRRSMSKRLQLSKRTQAVASAIVTKHRQFVFLPYFRGNFAGIPPADQKFRAMQFAGGFLGKVNMEIADALKDEEAQSLIAWLQDAPPYAVVAAIKEQAPLPDGLFGLMSLDTEQGRREKASR